MSNRILTACWFLDLPVALKLVLISLADQANDDGLCYPSVAFMVKRCSMGERTVQRHLSTLEKTGYVRRDPQPGRKTHYWVTITEITPNDTGAIAVSPVTLSDTPVKAMTPVPKEGGRGANSCTGGVPIRAQRGATAVSPKAFEPKDLEPQEPISSDVPSDPVPNGDEKPRPSKPIEIAERVLKYLNDETGNAYRLTHPSGAPTRNASLILALLKHGYTAAQLRRVVVDRVEAWKGDPKMLEFLRPETLFGPRNFSQYLGRVEGQTGG